MFAEHGAIELIFLAAVALIVVGPKDLPVLMRKVGQITAKMRGLAAEFRASFEELARQSELDELRKEVEALRQGQLGMSQHQTEIEREFDELHHSLHPPPPGADAWSPPPPYIGAGEADDDQIELPLQAPTPALVPSVAESATVSAELAIRPEPAPAPHEVRA